MFLFMLLAVVVARSSCERVVICCVRYVMYFQFCFHIMGPMARHVYPQVAIIHQKNDSQDSDQIHQ